ncbi:50S ribosomal protein L35 [candidate division WOR-1 bacterium RIFOXYC2_FULL_37_10]|uniref:Large ribosomal subunit protein bL35 n=1 Tax=candidate division WOR-1 bacterium RIFOXYB2_FULL_37_13 TaxID=1802579 RepID=A0A1F4SNK7_UNCSA|nr:MAG: 50S ribosomal protein L35 [candidate division WOR-1 bacterium RIFOXYA2_FULL_37_7]OGC22026.1 MAG: 50S ribosomal protein L35 [candidate division WOR-1 bacterium RIFOXYB2_FULL_37_13]OGC33054.1 MAG: 50S ribosomal protein L35 [candidate division WOR-1 bacterium RIFOXYC2_FULL_37_10]
MPKQKTRKAAVKRFKITGTGKVMRRGAKTKHLLECKSSSQKRRYAKDREISKTDYERIKVMIPYGKS